MLKIDEKIVYQKDDFYFTIEEYDIDLKCVIEKTKYQQPVKPSDIEQFFEYIFSHDEISWLKIFQGYNGDKPLDRNLSKNLYEIDNSFIKKAKNFKFKRDITWLSIIYANSTKQSFEKFVEKLNLQKEYNFLKKILK
jgi:hypothetical protein